jgi:hypothetical protein
MSIDARSRLPGVEHLRTIFHGKGRLFGALCVSRVVLVRVVVKQKRLKCEVWIEVSVEAQGQNFVCLGTALPIKAGHIQLAFKFGASSMEPELMQVPASRRQADSLKNPVLARLLCRTVCVVESRWEGGDLMLTQARGDRDCSPGRLQV